MATDSHALATSPFWARALGLLRGSVATKATADDDPGHGRDHPPAESASRAAGALARQLVSDDRYVFVLLKEATESIDGGHAAPAWKALGIQMALVPGGVVPVV